MKHTGPTVHCMQLCAVPAAAARRIACSPVLLLPSTSTTVRHRAANSGSPFGPDRGPLQASRAKNPGNTSLLSRLSSLARDATCKTCGNTYCWFGAGSSWLRLRPSDSIMFTGIFPTASFSIQTSLISPAVLQRVIRLRLPIMNRLTLYALYTTLECQGHWPNNMLFITWPNMNTIVAN